MKSNKHYFFIILFAFITLSANAQYFSNPSFEGTPGISLSPPDWIPFSPNSTPDTEPLDCDDFIASHGETYLTMVVRGDGSTFPNTVENCQTQLTQALIPGNCYTLSLDLASRDDVGHYVWGTGFIAYQASVSLKIFTGTSASEKGELLVETDEINSSQWENFAYSFKPEEATEYITLEASHSGGSSGLGNLLIDNMELSSEQAVSTVRLNGTYETSDLPVTITASESESYNWTPTSGLSCYDCQSPEVNSDISATYSCQVINAAGCPAIDLFILTFADEPGTVIPQDFKIPNVFTPNKDGFNDYFEIPELPPFSSLQIFDRSGKQLFISEEYNNNWDGVDMANNELPEGTYWYILITPGFSGKYKGSVYLKRE